MELESAPERRSGGWDKRQWGSDATVDALLGFEAYQGFTVIDRDRLNTETTNKPEFGR